VRETARRHYRVPDGMSLSTFLKDKLQTGENRVIAGDALSGQTLDPSGFLGGFESLTVIPEGRQRDFLGWMTPGLLQFSHSRLFLSTWLRPRAQWNHTTLLHGGRRSMVVTGLYDRFVPLGLMTDFLIRAVLAKDTTESVQLGLLETDPEDFALAAFVCPSKMDLMGIIRKGLDDVEAEGL
ncbi:MAG: NADH:ubiquinone reductase (Na(+)-transporting) subunit A, partial [Kiritimatiellia bacterium]|nr:NADH:ubiquinone reductase (Na(+)-transporting) subunit A [Kiritimatiellia bacterium]